MTSGAEEPLRVEFAGDCWELDRDDSITFGREADIVIDTNPHLHRRLGRLRWHDGVWWLSNVGSAIALDVCDAASPSRMTIAPGTSAPVPFRSNQVRFKAGGAAYELLVTTSQGHELDDPSGLLAASTTIDGSRVALNHEQRLLLVALAERRLRDRTLPPSEIAPNRVVADRLGWALTKFNRKLDNLCARFDRLGVAGLKGDVAGLASNRRERLVDHAITAGLIRIEDLALLERHER